MESNQTVNLYVTYVEQEGPFLKIWGQTEKNNAIYVEQFLAGASQHFDMGVGKVHPQTLQPGTLACAKYKDNKYYRARIMNMCIQDTFVEVSFVDFGNKDIVSSENIRSLQNFPSSFISIPPLAIGFIFAEAHCVGGGVWDDRVFESISKEIKYREVQCQLLIQATQYFLVKIYIDGTDLCSILIQRALMQPITLQAQQAVLLSMSMQKQMIQQVVPPAQTTTATINTYKACTLEPGCQYQVYVSYVNDGPCQFSVQLKQTEDALAKLMSDINSVGLRLLEDLPIPGTICLAKCQEDDSVCRAVVTNEVDNQFKVFYVDFGNYEVVPIDALYQIPFKYVLPKVMAIRYALAGVEKSTLTMEMQLAFKQFVDNRLLHMKVLPTPTRMAIPKCELWDPESKISALEIVNRAAQHAYPEPISLTRGFSQSVKVSFVYSCSRFYVQLFSKEVELSNLMTELQEICQLCEPLDPSILKVDLPCCALFESDQLWYRSQVVNVIGDRVKVRYIDYGNEEEVPSVQLRGIEGEQLTVLRPQAIECCLNGYQNMEDDAERDALLEEIVLEGVFTMKVVEMLDKKALVDLYDTSNYNVASLLLDKIAAAKSQVSPMLVQAGNKIEHRKSSHSPKEWQNNGREQNFRGDRERNQGRETNSWNDRTNDRGDKPWRQNNREDRNYGNSNDGNERGSWRQNNRGFSPNTQRPDNRDTAQKQDSWNNTANNNTEAAPSEEWNNTDSNTVVNDEWSTPTNDTGHGNDRRQNDYGKNRGGFDRDNRRDGRGDRFGGNQRDGEFRKKPDYRGGGSDDGSDTGYHKGPRTSSRNDRPAYQPRHDRNNYDSKPPRQSSFDDKAEDSWNVSAVTAPTSDSASDPAPSTASYGSCEVVGTEGTVGISWFHNPGLFYCQLLDSQDKFKAMMEEIQQFYKNRKPERAVAGAPVIGLFPEDNVLYRAQIIKVLGAEYKVYYVDFGNVSTVSKVWPIEKKFMETPAQAIECGLRGVSGVGEDWGDADRFGAYFDKPSFVCRFVDKVEDKILVDLFHGSEDVAQQLVRDGLAVSTLAVMPDIEIALLLGQQLRATLMSVNNLSDIIIALECGLAVSCAAHNLATATETFEDTLKGLLEQTVIVYVDNVIDNKLEVTFYDTEGNKLVIVEPDEGAFDTVERLCPLPVLRSTLAGYVSFADSASVFLQPTEYSELLAYLLDQLFATYDGQTQETSIVPEEGAVYAVRSEDGNWYRGRVASFDDEKAVVSYLDYGNSESVGFAEIRELEDKFLDICMMSLQIITPDAESFLDKDVTATIAYGENGWEGIVVLSESTVISESIASTQPVKDQDGSADTGFVTSSLEPPESEVAPATESDESNGNNNSGADRVGVETMVAVEVVAGTEEGVQSVPIIGQSVFASHVDSPNEFYLQFAESLNAIEELQAELQEQVAEMPPMENPATGMLCAAPYSVDGQWYRAEILDADADITTVRFVDFGNTDVIDNKATPVRTLSSKLLSLALYATRCSLKVKPKDDEWNAITLEVFEKLALADSLSAEFLDQDEKTSYVDLYSDGVNVREGLLQQNLALPADEASAGQKPTTGFVSHLNSPSEFWVQLENCVDELEWIAEQLSAAETFPELEDHTPGTLCAALFPDDQMWYRARILSNTVAGIELLFIDYGNSSSSDRLRQLPEDLVATAALAQKCCLQKPEGVHVWSPEACAKFTELSLDGQTIFTVKKLATDETSTVQLLLDGTDVTELLAPITEEGYVKVAETLQKLRIEKASGETVEAELELEPLAGQELGVEAAEKFGELNEQGTTLFQIEFVNDSTVRLYLNGQDIRPQLGGMLTASSDNSQTENDALIEGTGLVEGEDSESITGQIELTVESENFHENGNKDSTELLPEVNEIIQDLQTEVLNEIDQTISSEIDDVIEHFHEDANKHSTEDSNKIEQTISSEIEDVHTNIEGASNLEEDTGVIEEQLSSREILLPTIENEIVQDLQTEVLNKIEQTISSEIDDVDTNIEDAANIEEDRGVIEEQLSSSGILLPTIGNDIIQDLQTEDSNKIEQTISSEIDDVHTNIEDASNLEEDLGVIEEQLSSREILLPTSDKDAERVASLGEVNMQLIKPNHIEENIVGSEQTSNIHEVIGKTPEDNSNFDLNQAILPLDAKSSETEIEPEQPLGSQDSVQTPASEQKLVVMSSGEANDIKIDHDIQNDEITATDGEDPDNQKTSSNSPEDVIIPLVDSSKTEQEPEDPEDLLNSQSPVQLHEDVEEKVEEEFLDNLANQVSSENLIAASALGEKSQSQIISTIDTSLKTAEEDSPVCDYNQTPTVEPEDSESGLQKEILNIKSEIDLRIDLTAEVLDNENDDESSEIEKDDESSEIEKDDESIRALEKSKRDKEIELIQRIESLSAKSQSPKKLPSSSSGTVARKTSSPSKLPSPMKNSEKSSPTKESPKKTSPKKVTPTKRSPNKESPTKSTPNTPIKVSPRKESTTKVSPDKEAIKSVKTSPVKKDTSKSPIKDGATVKKNILLDSVKKMSPSKEASPASASASNHDEKIACLNRPETPSGDNSEVEAILKNTLLKSEVRSRPQSSCSGRVSFDEKIVPACISRPETPNDVDSEVEAILKTASMKSEVRSRPQSSCSGRLSFDEKIVPACISRPETPSNDTTKVEAALKSEVRSRPQSSCSGKMSFDEKIVPACLSRPTSALDGDSEVDAILKVADDLKEKNEVKSRPESACSGKIHHDEKILSAALSGQQTTFDEDADVGVSK